MYTLIIACALAANAGTEVEIETLDGQTVAGTLAKLDAQGATLDTPGGSKSLAADDLVRILPKELPAAVGRDEGVGIELVDGSSLAAREYLAEQGRARVTLADGQAIELPTAAVVNVRLRPPSEAVAAQWSKIVALRLSADVLVVRKGETLDYHKGVLRDVTDAVVHFELDGDVLPVKRANLQGFIYHHPRGDPLPEPVCQILDAGGSRWSVRSLSLGQGLQWTTPGGVSLTRPLAGLREIDFSRSKIQYLSDLKAESVAWTPFFGGDQQLPTLARFFGPREDQSLESRPLRLGGKQYAKGLALHSRTEMVYRLPGRFRWLKATAGIDDEVRPQGHVSLVIRGDDKVLYEGTLAGTDEPRPIELDLGGVRRLSILVDFGQQMDVADHLDLCNARIIK